MKLYDVEIFYTDGTNSYRFLPVRVVARTPSSAIRKAAIMVTAKQ